MPKLGYVYGGAVPADAPLASIVAEAMVAAPKLCGASATVGEVRALFADEHVHAALIVEGHTLQAVVERADLEHFDDRALARTAGRTTGRVVVPNALLATVHREMLALGQRRLAVVDDSGRLLGLLCLKRSGAGFCRDADVRSRWQTPAPPPGRRRGRRAMPGITPRWSTKGQRRLPVSVMSSYRAV